MSVSGTSLLACIRNRRVKQFIQLLSSTEILYCESFDSTDIKPWRGRTRSEAKGLTREVSGKNPHLNKSDHIESLADSYLLTRCLGIPIRVYR